MGVFTLCYIALLSVGIEEFEMNTENLVAFVTGGASGLGYATAKKLSKEGCKVTLIDSNSDKVQEAAAELSGYAICCDVSDEEQVRTSINQSESYWGQPSRIIVNCAGVATAAKIISRDGNVSTQKFRDIININLLGSYYVLSYAAQSLLKHPCLDDGNRGVIINTSSIAFEDGQIGQSGYSASKGAVASLTLPAAREFGKDAIRVVSIAPGLFKTPLLEGLSQDVISEIEKNIPYPNRLGSADEYANLVLSIVNNDYINGTTIRIDGACKLPYK